VMPSALSSGWVPMFRRGSIDKHLTIIRSIRIRCGVSVSCRRKPPRKLLPKTLQYLYITLAAHDQISRIASRFSHRAGNLWNAIIYFSPIVTCLTYLNEKEGC
jgi:hypothetical protein